MRNVAIILSLILTTTLAEANLVHTGVDSKGKTCQVVINSQDGNIDDLSLIAGGMSLQNIPVFKTDISEVTKFSSLLIERAENVYSPVIGAPITIGNLGLLKVEGEIHGNYPHQLMAVKIYAKGGLLNWYRKTFVCQMLKRTE